MNFIGLAEAGYLPDWLIRMGIRRLLASRLQERRRGASQLMAEFVQLLKRSAVALATEQANAQHYEVPAAFFETVLGPRLKYSCCFYPDKSTRLAERADREDGDRSLAQAEDAMLDLTCQRAEISDGMQILDLGCGWGSLSFWIAEHYPGCRITAVSNSRTKKQFIESRCRERGTRNIEVVTANVADYLATADYDRIVSVEMFEHMRNYETLLERVGGWLRPNGKLFVHIFCHRTYAYPFEIDGDGDWMARHFFTGGIMPSFDLLNQFDRDVKVSQSWFIDGRHYAQTCERWLKNLDAHRTKLGDLFARAIGVKEAPVVLQRWRIFFMACAELFAFGGGQEWGVGHYLLEPARRFADAELIGSF